MPSTELVVYTCLRFFFFVFTIPVWGIEYPSGKCSSVILQRRNAQSKDQVLPDFCLGEFSGHRTWVQGENRSTGKLRSQRCEFGLTEVSRICARAIERKKQCREECRNMLVVFLYWSWVCAGLCTKWTKSLRLNRRQMGYNWNLNVTIRDNTQPKLLEMLAHQSGEMSQSTVDIQIRP